MKVVIPVAGLGTRMLPATKAIPKESGNAIKATLTAATKSLCQFSINPGKPFFGTFSIILTVQLIKEKKLSL